MVSKNMFGQEIMDDYDCDDNGGLMKPKVGFICVHNSCRSQIAEALAKKNASDVFEAFSAGTKTKNKINQDAVRIMKKRYGIDMTQTQYSKTIDAIPPLDIIITMGCNVDCPWLPSKHREDWGLDDPSGFPDEVFEQIINQIEYKIEDLIHRIKKKEII